MSESSVAMDRAFSEVRRLCYAGLHEEVLLREVAERTRRAVPLEMYCMHANDPSSGLVTRVISDAGYGEVARVALERVQFEDMSSPFGWMVKSRLAALSLSASTGGKPERALRYREVMVPLVPSTRCAASSPWTESYGAPSAPCESRAARTSAPARSPSSAA